MKRIVVAAIVAASLASAGGVAAAQADSSPWISRIEAASGAPSPSITAAGAARAVTLEQVYGPLYDRYKAQFPKLDWNKNGCSFPSWMYDIRGLGDVIRRYGGEFRKSCDRHDFGYRNHGRSGVSRHAVDVRFRDNMYHQCDVNYTDGLPPWLLCRGAAKLIFEVVDSSGGRFW